SAEDGALLASLRDDAGAGFNVAAWNADSTQVLAGSESGLLYVWTPASDELTRIEHESAVLQATWAERDGSALIWSFERDGLAHIYSAEGEDAEERALRFEQDTLGIDWALARERALTWGGAGAAVIWDIAQGQNLVVRALDHRRT